MIKSDGIKLFLWDHTFNLNGFPRVNKTSTLSYYWLKTDTNHNGEETRLAQPCKSNDLVIQYWTCSLSYFFLLKLNIFAMEKVSYDPFTRSKWILKVWLFLLFFCCWFSTMRMISNLNWQHAVFISSSMFNLWIQCFLW